LIVGAIVQGIGVEHLGVDAVIFEIEQFNVREPMLYWIRAFPVALVLDWGNLLVTDEVRVDFRLIKNFILFLKSLDVFKLINQEI
jgi:hypothetical protein